jgi:hypothetical protein
VPFPAGRRIRLAFAVFALVLAGFATTSLPASAAVAQAGAATETVTGPADGAVIGGTAVVFSAAMADDGAGYELRWSSDAAVDAQTGRLVGTVGGGDTIVTTPEYALVDLVQQTYYWQVRSLDDGVGMWSVPRSFTIDPDGVGMQLETYPFTDPTASPAEAAGPASGVGGGVWIASAAAFAVLFLAVVLLGARQVRRAG